MAILRVQGWGASEAWKHHFDDAGPQFPVQGHGGGTQYKIQCIGVGQRITGSAGGKQYKLFCADQ